jgi:YVTN family beta-propeller protein
MPARAKGHPRSFRLASVVSIAVLALAACRPHDFPQYPANYREYAYVTNGGSGTVSIYDVVNVRLDREVQVGANPVAVVPSGLRAEVYVVNSGTPGSPGSVSVINAENNSVAATIPVHRQPVDLALDPDENFAYVANSGSNNVSVIDLKSHREVAVIGTGEEPVSVRVSPDGKTLAVANRRGNSVSLIDTASRTVRSAFEGCPGANDVVVLPDSTKVFASCSAGHQIMAIAIAHAGHPGQQDGAAVDRVEALLDVGRQPVHLALKPDGGEIFVSNSQSDTISEVITGTDDVLGAYLMGADPVRGIVSADNALLYVGNRRSQEVTIYSIDDGKRTGAVHVGDGPAALAFSSAGHLLFVVDAGSGDVAVVRTLDHSLFTLLPAGRGPNAIAVEAFRLP